MGSNKHKHKSKKRKHYRSSESSEREYEKERRHHKKHSKDKKEKRSSSKSILIDDYDSSNSDDVIIVTSPPPPPKISRNVSPSPPPSKRSKQSHASPPPPPVIRRRSPSPPQASSTRESRATTNSSAEASLSIEDTNRLRLKLGLKPLEVNSAKPQENDKEKKETLGGTDMGEFVHRPPENIATKTYNEKLKEKIALKREKRLLDEKLSTVKTLGESDSDEDVSKWVEKNRKIVNEKEQAEKKAKELDALDEVFGIGDLIEEDKRVQKKFLYTSKDLKGLKVGHSSENFVEGRDVILTLEDKGVLEDEDDTLVNVNIQDDERYKKNIDRRKRKPGYNAYDDSAELEEELLEDKRNVLKKYDEEIDGEKKASFKLGISAKMEEDARKEAIRKRLQERHAGKRLETLAMALTPVSEYLTEQEMQVKFKKTKKKVRKIRKKVLKADDLLREPPTTDEPVEDPALKGIGKRRPTSSRSQVKKEIKEESMDYDDLDFDDLPPPLPVDTSKIKIEEDEEDDKDLQLALSRARKLKQKRSIQPNAVETNFDENMEDDNKTGTVGNSIVLNATAEFCRTLGDIPTYGQAGNREEDAQELLDFERELQKERMRKEELDSLTTGWNEVAIDSTPVDITPAEVPILDAEPDIATGVAGALKMAIVKGYVLNESEKRPSYDRFRVPRCVLL